MKRSVTLAISILAVILAFVLPVVIRMRSDKPDSLIAKLRMARGEKRDELVMRLGVSRTDPVPAMIRGLEDPDMPIELRRLLIELLFKKHYRTPDDRIQAVLSKMLKAKESDIRAATVGCVALYGSDDDRVALLDLIDDPDPRVRQQVYGVFTIRTRRQSAADGLWADMDDDQLDRLIKSVQRQVAKETDPELRLRAREVLGREIQIRCRRSRESFQKTDVATAEKLLREAMEIDPESYQAKTRLVRLLLTLGRRDEALALARKHDAIFEIPRLSAAPTIDGDPSDPVWEEAFQHEEFFLNTSTWVARHAEGKGRVMIGHHNGTLYVAVINLEDDLDLLVARSVNRDSAVWRDDCVEIFFDAGNTGKDAYQMVINPLGGLYDSLTMDKSVNVDCDYAAKVLKDRGYWAVELAVAASALGAHITPESVWGINVVRTRIGAASEACSCWPLFGRNHNIDQFPIAVFTDAGEPAANK